MIIIIIPFYDQLTDYVSSQIPPYPLNIIKIL